ncbi:RNA polymerase factor sigma-54 [Blattabacterium cuenoti]|uniref:RNA polymerase factor sigma-54 n=1 Tax=Blattabacterium cuenoti TaxID=1653831 RepID=UPI00163C29AC|nr:RNA polymerase factor sigma-54 [Blattabacterium cuenoti]
MLKQQLSQKEQHNLSPQQIKLMKLIQLSVIDFEKKVRQELDDNPALESELYSNCLSEKDEKFYENENYIETEDEKNCNLSEDIDDYLNEYKSKENYNAFNKINEKFNNKNIPIIFKHSFQEFLKNQLHTSFFLNKKDLLIADFILGNIDNNGYLRRKIESIERDLFLIFGIKVTKDKIKKLLIKYIQKLEPIGIGARNLQECLLIQLNKKNKNKKIIFAKKIIQNCFELFIKKHYKKIQKKFNINKNLLKEILSQINKLNPKPGLIYSENSTTELDYIIPDFTISILDEKLKLTLNQRNIPELKISSIYLKMFKHYKYVKNDEKTLIFIKKKINSAKWFIDAVKQRENTLMLTMNAIINYQKEYFLTGDQSKIKPMILKNISQKIGLGISTISRVANSKYIDTPYGIFLIKNFFSEKMINKEGKYISSIEIKEFLGELIYNENKEKPFTDEELSGILKKKGYIVARRTIAKYRNQMEIPVARMRKMIK